MTGKKVVNVNGVERKIFFDFCPFITIVPFLPTGYSPNKPNEKQPLSVHIGNMPQNLDTSRKSFEKSLKITIARRWLKLF